MNFWKTSPLLRIIVPMIIGIIAGIYLHLSDGIWLNIFMCLTAILMVYALILRKAPTLIKEFIFGSICFATLLFGGISLVSVKTAANQSDHYQRFEISQDQHYLIRVIEIPKEKANSIQIIAQVTALKTSSNLWQPTSGHLLLYFSKDTSSYQILQGDLLLIHSNLQDIAPPHNPGQFNYKQYLEFNQIYQQGFVDKTSWQRLETNQWSIIKFASNIRNYLLQKLKNAGLKGEELGVASALILGYKDDLDEELKHSYSSAGATHVLAVSGLHVGIIYIALSFLIGLFDRNEKLRFTRLISTLVVLWFYATITGLSPSVVRAATMFSFVAVGKAFDRNSNIYNTLAASALVLLIYNPYLIMEVGFQLSYLAVLGIVYFQPIIYKQIYFKRKITDYVWSITSVSIAAQLTTFPLGLLYFHQFPTYFLISNLVVIPGAVLIISTGLLLFITSWLPVIYEWIGIGLHYIIYGMNWVVKAIDQLPFPLIEGISITILECWMIYFMILHLVIAKETRKLKFINIGLITLTLFLCLDLYEDDVNSRNQQFIIYDIKDEANINFVFGSRNIFIAAPSLTENRSSMLFNVFHHWDDLDLDKVQKYRFEDTIDAKKLLYQKGLFQFKNFSGFNYMDSLPNQLLKVNLLIINNNDFVPFHEFSQKLNFDSIVIGNRANRKYYYELKALESTIYYDVPSQGAYIKTF